MLFYFKYKIQEKNEKASQKITNLSGFFPFSQ